MPEIRTRLTVDDPADSRFEFMVPRFAVDPERQLSATSIACPECDAQAEQWCLSSSGLPAARLCRDRVQLALLMLQAGELEGVPIAERPKECPACRKKRNANNTKYIACSEPHRCSATDRAKRCAAPIEPGKARCRQYNWTA